MTDFGEFDVAVVGGGVNGAGIARDAAGRGLSALLVEKGDLAEGTSSRSSKLVHGGLRYLEHYEFRLVRDALIEREVLLRAAPHIVRPLRFVLPHEPGQRPAWMIRLGLFLYDHLGGRKILPPSRALDLDHAPEGKPLRKDFARGFEYSDCCVDDARLVVLNALDAERLGARVLTRTALVEARRDGGRWSLGLSGGGRAEARALVNAAGPWVESVLGKAAAGSDKKVRLIKGSHIVTRKFWEGEQAYILQTPDGRVVFAMPHEDDFALIGTTEIPFVGRPEDVAIDKEEIAYLLEAVGRYFFAPPAQKDIVYAFAGVRPLFDDAAKDPSEVTRDFVLDLDAPPRGAPLLAVFGGKITTYRKLSEQALDRLARTFPKARPAWTASASLPGGAFPPDGFAALVEALQRRHAWLPAGLALSFARRYGLRAEDLLDGATSIADLGRPFGATLYEREARFLVRNEWAQSAEDILFRRTKHGLRLSPEQRSAFEAWFAQVLASPGANL